MNLFFIPNKKNTLGSVVRETFWLTSLTQKLDPGIHWIFWSWFFAHVNQINPFVNFTNGLPTQLLSYLSWFLCSSIYILPIYSAIFVFPRAFQCSSSCGVGSRSRLVNCYQENRPSDQCDVHTKPAAVEQCRLPSCITAAARKGACLSMLLSVNQY